MFELSEAIVCDASLFGSDEDRAAGRHRFLCCCRKPKGLMPHDPLPPELADAPIVDTSTEFGCDRCGARHTFREAFEGIFSVRHERGN